MKRSQHGFHSSKGLAAAGFLLVLALTGVITSAQKAVTPPVGVAKLPGVGELMVIVPPEQPTSARRPTHVVAWAMAANARFLMGRLRRTGSGVEGSRAPGEF